MENFLATHQQKFKSLVGKVDTYERSLRSLSDWWGKIALIGKINSLDVAATILEDMDVAKDRFNELQGQLINSLVREHLRKAVTHDHARCQMAIDVLIRNLFERTADIGFLALDDEVSAFLADSASSEADVAAIRARLRAYVAKYSVYDDVILLSPAGEVRARLAERTSIRHSRAALVQEALSGSSDFTEYFGPLDLFADGKPHLVYAHRVMQGNHCVGVICLCFRFEDEMQGIFANLLPAGSKHVLALLDRQQQVIASSDHHRLPIGSRLPVDGRPMLHTWQGEEYLLNASKGQPYQGYAGPEGWQAVMLMPVSLFRQDRLNKAEASAGKAGSSTGKAGSATGKADKPQQVMAEGQTAGRRVSISGELRDIRKTSMMINDELELIVLNGIITAARKESAEFMPVLEAIKRIGRDIDTVFSESIDSLYGTALEGQLDEVRLQSALAVDILDRNLYERANDCRWWALNPVLREQLASAHGDKALMQQVLASINALYTVYTTLYLYDDHRQMLVFSDDRHEALLGKRAASHSGAEEALGLKDAQAYSVSDFVPFECYENRHTYIYNAAVRHPENDGRIVGGIGIVFDSEPQFRAILQDVLPRDEEGNVPAGCFALFTDRQGHVLSCSDDRYRPGDVLAPPVALASLPAGETASQWLELGNEGYLLGMSASAGYREYKTCDGYDNDILAWVLMPA